MVQSLAHLIVKARIDRRTWLNVNCSIFRAVSVAVFVIGLLTLIAWHICIPNPSAQKKY